MNREELRQYSSQFFHIMNTIPSQIGDILWYIKMKQKLRNSSDREKR